MDTPAQLKTDLQFGPTPEQLLRELRRRRNDVVCLIATSQREIDWIDRQLDALKKQTERNE